MGELQPHENFDPQNVSFANSTGDHRVGLDRGFVVSENGRIELGSNPQDLLNKDGVLISPEVVVGSNEILPWMEEETIRAYDSKASDFAEMYKGEKFRRRVRKGIIFPFSFYLNLGIEEYRMDELESGYIPTVWVVGGGSGQDAADLMEEGFNVLVCEPAGNMADECSRALGERSRLIESGGGVSPSYKVYKLTAQQMIEKLEPEAVDGIFANSFMRHLTPDNMIHLFRAYKHVLKPGGLLASSLKIGDKGEVIKTHDFGNEYARYSQVLTDREAEAMFTIPKLENIATYTSPHPATSTWRKWKTFFGRKL